MVVVTRVINKRPIVEKIMMHYCVVKKGDVNEYNKTVPEDYIDYEWVPVERYPAGTILLKLVESVGSSGGKDIKYFQYIHDLVQFLKSDWFTRDEYGNSDGSYSQILGLGLALTKLQDDEYSKVVIKRNWSFEAVSKAVEVTI